MLKCRRCQNKKCGCLFVPCPQVPHQKFCSRRECQQARKREWNKKKLASDPEYREARKDAQKKWKDKNPDYWKDLRDIEVCLRSQNKKLYHMGIRGKVSRSTLADANEKRDWRIYAELAQTLIATARGLCRSDSFLDDLDETVYALDSTTIDLCLSVFPWAAFRKTKAAIKLHTFRHPDLERFSLGVLFSATS